MLVPVLFQKKARIFAVMQFSRQDLYSPSATHSLWAGPGLAVPTLAGVLPWGACTCSSSQDAVPQAPCIANSLLVHLCSSITYVRPALSPSLAYVLCFCQYVMLHLLFILLVGSRHWNKFQETHLVSSMTWKC